MTSWFKRHLAHGRWDRTGSGDPGRPDRHIRTTEQLPPEENIVHFQEKPRMCGRLSAGRSRDEAAAMMHGRGTVAPKEEKFDREGRAGPSPITNYTTGAPTMARDRHDEE